jgi:mRNA interferase RelE/StbE
VLSAHRAQSKHEQPKAEPSNVRLIDFLEKRVAPEPRRTGKAMRGDERAWRYRVGSYRIVCDIDDRTQTVYVVRVGHRSSVYE